MIKGKDVNQMDAEDIHFRCLSSEKVTLDQIAEAGSQQMDGNIFLSSITIECIYVTDILVLIFYQNCKTEPTNILNKKFFHNQKLAVIKVVPFVYGKINFQIGT